jgi:hypothetical protein
MAFLPGGGRSAKFYALHYHDFNASNSGSMLHACRPAGNTGTKSRSELSTETSPRTYHYTLCLCHLAIRACPVCKHVVNRKMAVASKRTRMQRPINFQKFISHYAMLHYCASRVARLFVRSSSFHERGHATRPIALPGTIREGNVRLYV